MLKYRRSFVAVGLSFVPAILQVPVASSALSASLLLYAIINAILVRWGHLMMDEIAPRKSWYHAGVIASIVGVLWLLLWAPGMKSAPYLESVVAWFILYASVLVVFVSTVVIAVLDSSD